MQTVIEVIIEIETNTEIEIKIEILIAYKSESIIYHHQVSLFNKLKVRTSNKLGVLNTSQSDPLETSSVTIALFGGSIQAAMYRQIFGWRSDDNISTSSKKAFSKGAGRFV